MNLTIEDLKVIRLALHKTPLSGAVITAIDNVDKVLAENNLKLERVLRPRKKYQRTPDADYIFVEIKK